MEDGRLVILVGYSKGGLDILRFVVDYPELATGIDAVVGVATPVFGTPLADLAAPAYRALVASLPSDKCPPGDSDVLASLQPDAAMRNDGQVVAADAIIPGSTLLGYAVSDHWGIALTTEVEHPVLLARPDPAAFPIEQLLFGIVTFVAGEFAPTEGGRQGKAASSAAESAT